MTRAQKYRYVFLPLACFGAVLPAQCIFTFIATGRYVFLLGFLALPLTGLARKIDRELQAEGKR